jgi:cytochrome P450
MLKLKDMPGPKGHPLLGHIGEMKRDVLGFFTRLGEDFPELARVRFFHINGVSVHTPELVDEVLVKHHAKLRKSYDFKELRHALGDGLVTSEGELWKRQRKLVQPSFHHERIQAYGEIMARRTDAHVDGWADGEQVDLHAELSRVTLEIVSEALFGLEVDDFADDIEDAIAQFMDRFEALFTSWVPVPLGAPTPANRRMRKAIEKMDAVIYEMIAARRAKADKGSDLLGRLISASDDEGGMSDQQLRDELVTLMIAGHETTALALSFAFFLLAQHPDEMARVFAEVDALDGPPTVADLERLTYTRHVVDEAMRLYPPAWGTGREVVEPFALAGYWLPKGTQLFVTSWITHRDGRYFEDPLAFRPARWEEPSWPKNAYFPFGAGPRKCIGFHFALMEAVIVLATVARRFDMELAFSSSELELVPTVTMRPRRGMPVRLRAREGAKQRAA